MNAIKVMEFQKEYSNVNLELTKNKLEYDKAIIALYISELEDGFIVKRIYKTSKNGTKVTYKPCENLEEQQKYIKIVNKYIDDFEENYKKSIGFRLQE